MLVHDEFKDGFEYFFRKPLFIKQLKASADIDVALYMDDTDEMMWSNKCNNKLVDTSDPAQALVDVDGSIFFIQPKWCEAKKKPIK